MARASLLLLAASVACAAAASIVEQIHIAYTGISGQYSVDFVAPDASGQVGISMDNATWVYSNSTSFYYDTIGYLHQGLLEFPNVQKGQTTYYKVRSAKADWSAVFPVHPIPARYPSEISAIFGDFGYANDICLNALIKDAQQGTFDSVLHVGDWAYNMETTSSTVGNDFMNDIQGYAALSPVMPALGNHEACPSCPGIAELPESTNNFTQYRARLHSVSLNAGKNAGTDNNIYYSFNQGLTHFIVFSAEAYAYNSGAEFIANQLAFMKADLSAVDRSNTPWVVALVHKDWTMETSAYADFSPVLENLGVDLLFCGHVHHYNRYYPYNAITQDTDTASVSADGQTYTNPKYLVTIVTGAAGDHELESKCSSSTTKPSLTCTENYGYGYFQAVNATHATWSFKTVQVFDKSPDYSDNLLIVQENHGPRN